MRVARWLAGGVLAVTACGGAPAGPGAHVPTTGPVPTLSCLAPEDAASPLRFQAADGATIDGVSMGSGSTAVVFSNDRGDDTCAWLPLAREVKGMGYRVVLWKYGGVDPHLEQEAAGAIAKGRTLGSNRVVVVGASVGAAAAFVAATTLEPPIAGLVALTCEQDFPAQGLHALQVAPAFRAPILLVSTEYGYYATGDQTRQLFAAIASPDKKLLVLPGSQTGIALLGGSTGDEVHAALMQFLQTHGA